MPNFNFWDKEEITFPGWVCSCGWSESDNNKAIGYLSLIQKNLASQLELNLAIGSMIFCYVSLQGLPYSQILYLEMHARTSQLLSL